LDGVDGMGILTLRLDDALEAKLSREAQRDNLSRSELVRQALSSFLHERERQRFIDHIARAARRLDPDESRARAEEALAAGNEALTASEPRAQSRAKRRAKPSPKGGRR